MTPLIPRIALATRWFPILFRSMVGFPRRLGIPVTGAGCVHLDAGVPTRDTLVRGGATSPLSLSLSWLVSSSTGALV